MKPQPAPRRLVCLVLLVSLLFAQPVVAQTPAPAAAGGVPALESGSEDPSAPVSGSPAVSERRQAVETGKWPAQLAASRGDIQPNRYGPQRTDPSEGIPAHAYSPFDERLNREHPCPRGGCEYEKDHVLIKLAPEIAMNAAEKAGAWTSSESLNRGLKAQGIETLAAIFPNARPPKAGALVETADGDRIPAPDLTRWYRANYRRAPEDVYAAVDALSALPGIAWAEPDYLRKPVGEPSAQSAAALRTEAAAAPAAAFNDPLYSQQWHLGATKVPEAWDWLTANGYPAGGSRDIIVAVIDTGVDYTHPDLAANMWVNAAEFNGVAGVDDDGNGYVDDIHGADTVTPDGNPIDDHGHGTHVAGIIAAQANNGIGGVGVAYNAQIMALKAAQYSGVLSASDIAEAIYYAVEKGADVINMSFGGYTPSQAEEDALSVAYGASVLVAAAGNDAKPNLPCRDGRDMYPAAYDWVLGVMAERSTPAANGDYLASFSNYDCAAKDSHEYEVMAPGVDIWSALPGARYAAWDGTSMATPVVSGIAALARTRWSDRSLYSSRFIMGQVAETGAAVRGYTFPNAMPRYYRASEGLAALTTYPTPSLAYLQHWLVDSTSFAGENDGDGMADSGETIDLGLTIRNHWGSANPVEVKLEAIAESTADPDPYVTMIVDTVDYGAIGAFAEDDNGVVFSEDGGAASIDHPFRFTVAANTPNDHVIPFLVTMTAGNGYNASDPAAPYTFTARFSLIVQRGRELPPRITSDLQLTRDDYWIAVAPVVIDPGVTVTVEPGTQIQFGAPCSQSACPDVYLRVDGTLRAAGTQESPVEFFGDQMLPKRRSAIFNYGTTELRYAKIADPILGRGSITGVGWVQAPINLMEHVYLSTDRPMTDPWMVWSDEVRFGIFDKMQGTDNVSSLTAGNDLRRFMRLDTVLVDAPRAYFSYTYYPVFMSISQSSANDSIVGPIVNSVFLQDNVHQVRTEWRFWAALPIASEFSSNAFLSRLWVDPAYQMRLDASYTSSSTVFPLQNNFWGTTSPKLVSGMIYDNTDNPYLGSIQYEPVLATPPSSAYPFVASLSLRQDGVENPPDFGTGEAEVTLKFNRDMNVAVQPRVTFGPAAPYSEYGVSGDWVDARTWRGVWSITPLTGDGYQLIRVAGAVAADDPWLVTGDDGGRFRFEIITSGTESMNLQATGGEGYVDLMWVQDDFDLLAGYNLYRSTSPTGTFTRLNDTIIPPDQKEWRDTNVTPGVPYYYYFKVVKSDMSESGASNTAEGTPIDTIAPTITHTPITSATYGMGLSISADVTDNVAVKNVTLFYRKTGTGSYTSAAMAHTTGNKYTATIPGSAVVAPGIEYYIEATDGISTSRHGTATSPHPVSVTDKPTVTGVTPNKGPTAGNTAVTIAGSNFQAGATVTFGGAPASGVVVQSGSQITCQTPPHYATAVDVTVTNPSGGAGTLLHGYTYESNATTLGLPDANGGQNTTVEIPVNAANVSGLVAAGFTVTFDPAVLTPTGAATGNLTPNWSLSANTGTAGQLRVSMASGGSSVTGSGVLANLKFTVNGAPGASTVLNLSEVLLNDGAIPAEIDPGSFHVNQVYSVAGMTRYWSGGAGVPGVVLSLSGDRTYTGSSAASGAYTVGGAPTDDYTLTPSKSDGASGITAYDASLALQHDSRVALLTGNALRAADVNKSGAVTSMDAHYILEKSVDLITLPFSGASVVWDFDPANRAYANLAANLTGQDFTAILLGDPSGNWTAGALAAGKTAAVASGSATLALPEVISAPLADATLDLALAANTAAAQGVDLTLRYDPAVLDFQGAALGDLPGDWTIAQNEPAAGTIKLGLAGSTPVTDDRVLARLTFRAIGAKGAGSAITFAQSDLNEAQISVTASAGEIVIDTPPVLDLAASRPADPANNAVTLTWSGVGSDAHHYEVWRAFGAAYFTPDAGGERIAAAVSPAAQMSFTDTGAQAAQPGTQVFYLVRAVDAAGRPSPTYNRVGAVTFGLRGGEAR